jgi:Tfp pilus assembly protein PilO
VTFNKVKQTYLVGMVAIVVMALVSWFFLVSPRMAQAAATGDQQVQVEAFNAKTQAQIAKLTTMKKGLVQERLVASALATKFPPTADQPTLYREIGLAAEKAGIKENNVTSLGPAAPVLGGVSAGAKLPGAGAAAKGTDNLATMEVSFNATGTFTQMVDMLTNLEDLPRSFLITQVNLSSTDPAKVTIAVQGNMFVYRAVPDPDVKPVAPKAVPSSPTVTSGVGATPTS